MTDQAAWLPRLDTYPAGESRRAQKSAEEWMSSKISGSRMSKTSGVEAKRYLEKVNVDVASVEVGMGTGVKRGREVMIVSSGNGNAGGGGGNGVRKFVSS